jgi:hypothetical protein
MSIHGRARDFYRVKFDILPTLLGAAIAEVANINARAVGDFNETHGDTHAAAAVAAQTDGGRRGVANGNLRLHSLNP